MIRTPRTARTRPPLPTDRLVLYVRVRRIEPDLCACHIRFISRGQISPADQQRMRAALHNILVSLGLQNPRLPPMSYPSVPSMFMRINTLSALSRSIDVGAHMSIRQHFIV